MSAPHDRSRPAPRRTSLRRIVTAGLAALFVGSQVLACAVASPHKVSAPPTDPNLEEATVDEAEATFDAAEEDLQKLMLTSATESGDAEDTQAADDPAPEPSVGQRGTRYDRAERASPCTRACKALGSMQRSADRLCELTGDEDERCESVRVRVESAEDLVRRFCPGCPS